MPIGTRVWVSVRLSVFHRRWHRFLVRTSTFKWTIIKTLLQAKMPFVSFGPIRHQKGWPTLVNISKIIFFFKHVQIEIFNTPSNRRLIGTFLCFTNASLLHILYRNIVRKIKLKKIASPKKTRPPVCPPSVITFLYGL